MTEIFHTDLGSIQEIDSLAFMCGVADNSIDLIAASPPFALL